MKNIEKNAFSFCEFWSKIGLFSRELTTAHSENTEIGRLNCFFEFCAWFHIACGRFTSDYAHFTFSGTFLTTFTHLLDLCQNVSRDCVKVEGSALPKYKERLFALIAGGEQFTNGQTMQHWVNICLFKKDIIDIKYFEKKLKNLINDFDTQNQKVNKIIGLVLLIIRQSLDKK